MVQKQDHLVTPPSWVTPLEQWTVHLKAGGQSLATVRTRRYPIIKFAIEMQVSPQQVTTNLLEQWLATRKIKPETRYSYRSSFRSFFEFACGNEIVATNPAAPLPNVNRPDTVPLPCPDSAIKSAIFSSKLREEIMLRLAAEHGLRIGEIAIQKGTDLIQSPFGLIITITGKGGKQRLAYVCEDEVQVIEYYRAAGSDYLFPGRIDGHLSPQHVGKLIGKLLPKGQSAHKLRTRFATTVYLDTPDLGECQLLMGHSSPKDTLRYVKLSAEKCRVMSKAARI